MAHKYNTPLICTLLLCQVVFLLCWARFGYDKHFSAMLSIFLFFWAVFRLCQAVFSYAGPFSALPTIYLLCWARLGSFKHFSAILGTFASTIKHFSSILSGYSALLSIFLLCWRFLCPTLFLLRWVLCFFFFCLFFCSALQYTAEQNQTRQSRKTT